MSLALAYTVAIAKQLKYHAVWEPGDPSELGDYGVVSSRVFKRLGNIKEFAVKFRASVSARTLWEFTSSGVKTSLFAGGAELPLAQLAAALPMGSQQAEIKIGFSQANSLFMRAHSSSWEEISDLRTVAVALRRLPDWDFGWRIISGRRIADSLIVLMNAEEGSTLSLSGQLDALANVPAGQITSAASLKITGDAALKYIGVSGPFLTEHIRVNRFQFLGEVRHATGGAGLPDLESHYSRIDPLSEPEVTTHGPRL